MKNILFFSVAILVFVSIGCQKESLTKTQNNTSTAKRGTGFRSSLSKPNTSFGALIAAPDEAEDPYQFITDVAGEIGLECIRDKAPVPGSKKVKILTSGYNVVLNFTSIGTMPMLFRGDTTEYKTDLQNIVSSFTTLPVVAVIENEESNSSYYSGSATDYINQLKAAITVMHSYGIPVANGGITSVGLSYLVYQDLLNRGLTAEADDYKNHLNIALNSSFTLDRASYVSTLLSSYTSMNLDYVNFHWRTQSPADSTYLGETIDYLKRTTNKQVISNELGQYDQDPETLTATVQMCQNYKMPYVLWYSGIDGRSYPLQNFDESLTPSGIAYKNFIAK